MESDFPGALGPVGAPVPQGWSEVENEASSNSFGVPDVQPVKWLSERPLAVSGVEGGEPQNWCSGPMSPVIVIMIQATGYRLKPTGFREWESVHCRSVAALFGFHGFCRFCHVSFAIFRPLRFAFSSDPKGHRNSRPSKSKSSTSLRKPLKLQAFWAVILPWSLGDRYFGGSKILSFPSKTTVTQL